MAVWTVKGGRNGEFEDAFIEEGFVSKGGRLPDLAQVQGKEDIKELFVQHQPELTEKQRIAHAGQFWSLVHRMTEGELVVLPMKTTGTIAIGEIVGPYTFVGEAPGGLQHRRLVKWLATDVPRDQFDQDLLYSFGAFATVARVKRDLAEERIRAVLGGAPPPSTASIEDQEPTTESAESIDVAEMAREQIRQVISQVFSGHDLTRLVASVLEAQSFATDVSPPGADLGVDILVGAGPLGLDSPRIVVQVKTGQAGFEEFRSLRGLMTTMAADQGLLVAWRGFKGKVRQEARMEHFRIRLWDADALLDALFEVYEKLPEDIRTELPLREVWALVPTEA